MDTADISFIIPVYNKQVEQLEECLRSLKNSKFRSEILIINDGSSLDLSKKYNDLAKKYGTLYFYKKNGGVGSARNLGIKLAKGKYITFVDADDVFFVNNIFMSDMNKRSDIIFYDVKRKNGSSTNYDIFKFENISKYPNYSDLWKYSFDQGLMTWSVAKLYLREFLLQNDLLFNTQMKNSEDFDFLVRVLLKKPRIQYNSRIVYLYKYYISTGDYRDEKYPIQIMNDLYHDYCLQQIILSRISSNEIKDNTNKKIRESAIKNIIRIYSNYLYADKNKAQEDISKFKSIAKKISEGCSLNLSSKIRLCLLNSENMFFLEGYFYIKKIYHYFKRG